MSENNDQNHNQESIDDLAAELKEHESSNEPSFLANYDPVSQAFPGDPHPNIMGFSKINWKSLIPWAKEKGWDVKTAPEDTHPDQKDIPLIRFTKINH